MNDRGKMSLFTSPLPSPSNESQCVDSQIGSVGLDSRTRDWVLQEGFFEGSFFFVDGVDFESQESILLVGELSLTHKQCVSVTRSYPWAFRKRVTCSRLLSGPNALCEVKRTDTLEHVRRASFAYSSYGVSTAYL